MKRLVGALAALALAAAGCGGGGPEGPKTYPVKGKVVFKGDGQPMTSGTVQFVHEKDSNLNGNGEIGAEGEFALFCFVGNKRVEGLAEGSYTATVIPPQGADQSAAQPTTLPDVYKVTAAGPNEFALSLPGKSKK
jgi:hypothetical protein